MRRSPRLGGNNGLDVRAFAGHGGNDDVAAHLFGTFAHAHQAVVAVQPPWLVRVESAAIVPDAKGCLPAVVVEFDRDLGGATVPDGIAQRLLADQQQLFIDERRRSARRAANLDVELYRPARDDTLAGLAKRARQVARGQPGRTQIPDRLPRLADRVFDLSPDAQRALARR